MAEVTNALMYEILKAVQARLEQMDGKIDELKFGQQALRTELIGIHQELSGIHMTLGRHETRFDRIERRLNIIDAPTTTP